MWTATVFALSYGFLFSFLLLILGEQVFGFLMTGVPHYWLGIGFVFGLVLGFFVEKAWRKMEGLNRELITALVLFLHTALFAIVGLVLGAGLGGNGILFFEFAGMQGYESAGLVLGSFGAFLGVWMSSQVLLPSSKKHVLLAANALVLLILLFAGDALKMPNLSSFSVLAMPTLTVILHYGFKL